MFNKDTSKLPKYNKSYNSDSTGVSNNQHYNFNHSINNINSNSEVEMNPFLRE